jgi:hypothetical protein
MKATDDRRFFFLGFVLFTLSPSDIDCGILVCPADDCPLFLLRIDEGAYNKPITLNFLL